MLGGLFFSWVYLPLTGTPVQQAPGCVFEAAGQTISTFSQSANCLLATVAHLFNQLPARERSSRSEIHDGW